MLRFGPFMVHAAAAAGLVMALTASKCEHTTTFVDAAVELCQDGLDNDQDGRIDCRDSECADQCVLDLTVRPTLSTQADTQTVSGTHKHASRIVVDIAPNNAGNGAATLTASEWTFKATGLKTGQNTLTITANDSSGQSKKVTAQITVTAAP